MSPDLMAMLSPLHSTDFNPQRQKPKPKSKVNLPSYAATLEEKNVDSLPFEECLVIYPLTPKFHHDPSTWSADQLRKFKTAENLAWQSLAPRYPTLPKTIESLETRTNSVIESCYVSISPIPANYDIPTLVYALGLIKTATRLPLELPNDDNMMEVTEDFTWSFVSASYSLCPPDEEKTSILLKLSEPSQFDISGDSGFPIHNSVNLTARYDSFKSWQGTIHIWPVSHHDGADLSNRSHPQDFTVLRAPATAGPVAGWAFLGADLSFHSRLDSLAEQEDFHVFMAPLHLQVPKHKPSMVIPPGPYVEELLFVFYAVPAADKPATLPLDLIRPLLNVPATQSGKVNAVVTRGLAMQGATNLSYFLGTFEHLKPPDFLVAPRTYASLDGPHPEIPMTVLSRAFLLDNPHLVAPTLQVEAVVKLPGPILDSTGTRGRPTFWLLGPPDLSGTAPMINQQGLLQMILPRAHFLRLHISDKPLQLGTGGLWYWYERCVGPLPWTKKVPAEESQVVINHDATPTSLEEDAQWTPVKNRRSERGGGGRSGRGNFRETTILQHFAGRGRGTSSLVSATAPTPATRGEPADQPTYQQIVTRQSPAPPVPPGTELTLSNRLDLFSRTMEAVLAKLTNLEAEVNQLKGSHSSKDRATPSAQDTSSSAMELVSIYPEASATSTERVDHIDKAPRHE